MNIVSIADAKARLSAYIKESEDTGPIIITRNGRPAAVLLPILDDDDLERLMLTYNPKFRQLIEQAEQRIKEEGYSGGITIVEDYVRKVRPPKTKPFLKLGKSMANNFTDRQFNINIPQQFFSRKPN